MRSKISVKDKAYQLYTSDPSEYAKYKIGNRLGMTQLDANQLGAQVCAHLHSRTCVHSGDSSGIRRGCAYSRGPLSRVYAVLVLAPDQSL